MSFKYSCFISYCHSNGTFMKSFVEQLKESLEDYIGIYLDEKVYIDEDRLRGGCHFNKELASSICQSVCMIVVYTPIYKRHLYCLREYRAMECVEKKRIKLLGDRVNNMGMIIPIIFRGDKEKIPPEIKENIHYFDFSKFTTASPHIKENEDYVAKIEMIAETIYEYYTTFDDKGLDPCSECDSFWLPSEEEVKPWGTNSSKPTPFPGRGVK